VIYHTADHLAGSIALKHNNSDLNICLSGCIAVFSASARNKGTYYRCANRAPPSVRLGQHIFLPPPFHDDFADRRYGRFDTHGKKLGRLPPQHWFFL
jgi:hypothetical protein